MRAILTRPWFQVLLVAVASFVAFLPALQAGFLNWDDDWNFVLNKRWRGLSWEHLAWMFTARHHGGYQPLSWLSFGVDYTLWSLNPRRFHLTNMVLHTVNALLFFGLVRELLRRHGTRAAGGGWAAAVGALLFAVHPLRVETVAWLTERRALVAGLFAILATTLYLRAHRPGLTAATRRRLLLLVWLAYTLSLLAKALVVTLPVVFLILDVHPLRRLAGAGSLGRRLAPLVLEKVPVLLVTGLVGAVARTAQQAGGAVIPWAEHGLLARTAQAAYGVWFYLGKTVWPAGLNPYHPLEEPLAWQEARYVVAAGGALAMTLLLWAWRRRRPALLTAWAVYLVSIAPVLGFTQSGPQLVAERYSYLACLPVAALAASFLAARWRPGRPRLAAGGLGALAVGALALLASLSHRQTHFWRDSVSLWQRAVALEPRSYLGNLSLGNALAERHRHREAVEAYRRALARVATLWEPWFNMGNSLHHLGREAEALAAYRRAHALAPERAAPAYGVALACYELERYEEAVRFCERARRSDPGYVLALNLTAEAFMKLGRRTEALAALRQYVRANPGDGAARRRLGQLERTGRNP